MTFAATYPCSVLALAEMVSTCCLILSTFTAAFSTNFTHIQCRPHIGTKYISLTGLFPIPVLSCCLLYLSALKAVVCKNADSHESSLGLHLDHDRRMLHCPMEGNE